MKHHTMYYFSVLCPNRLLIRTLLLRSRNACTNAIMKPLNTTSLITGCLLQGQIPGAGPREPLSAGGSHEVENILKVSNVICVKLILTNLHVRRCSFGGKI